MIILISAIFYLVVAFVSTAQELISIDKISSWYSPVAECMMSDAMAKIEYFESFEKCKFNLKSDANAAFATLQTESIAVEGLQRYHCCSTEISLQERGFLHGFKGFTDPNKKPVRELFKSLHFRNMSLIFLGDSTSSQTVNALRAELEREDGLKIETSFEWDITKTFIKKFEDLHSISVFKSIFGVYSYDGTLIIDLKMTVLGTSDLLWPLLKYLSLGCVVVVNVGHHLKHLTLPNNFPFLVDNMDAVVDFLVEINAHDRGQHIAIYRETTPTHFDSYDGKFETWETPLGYDHTVPNSWDSRIPMYHCRALQPNVTNRIENSIVESLISARKLDIPVIQTYKYFAPFFKINYGNCDGEAGYRRKYVDCVHLCAFSPLMWMPIWMQLQEGVTRQLELREQLKQRVPEAQQTHAKYFDRLFLITNQLRDNCAVTYVSCNGVLRLVPDDSTSSFIRNAVTKLGLINIALTSTETTINSTDYGLTTKWGVVGNHFVSIQQITSQKAMITSTHSEDMFMVTHNLSRALIPTYDIFVSLGGGGSTVPLMVIPKCQLEMFPLVPFNLNDFNQPYLIYFGDGLNISAYVCSGSVAHLIPDNATLAFVKRAMMRQGLDPTQSAQFIPSSIDGTAFGSTFESVEMMTELKHAAMIKSDNSTDVFMVTHDLTRAMIPTYETFLALDGGGSTVPLIEMPSCQLELFPLVAFELADYMPMH